jgi:hypothetical protein
MRHAFPRVLPPFAFVALLVACTPAQHPATNANVPQAPECPDSNAHCITAPECSFDEARQCNVCRCSTPFQATPENGGVPPIH